MNEERNRWKRIYNDREHYNRVKERLNEEEDFTSGELTEILDRAVKTFDQIMFELMRQNMLLQRYLADSVEEASLIVAKNYSEQAKKLESELLCFESGHVHAEQNLKDLELEYMDMIVDACSSGLEGFREIALYFSDLDHMPLNEDSKRLKEAVSTLVSFRRQTQEGKDMASGFARQCALMAESLKTIEKEAKNISSQALECSSDMEKVMNRYSAGAIVRSSSDEPDVMKRIADALVSAGMAMEDFMRANARSFEKISALVTGMNRLRRLSDQNEARDFNEH